MKEDRHLGGHGQWPSWLLSSQCRLSSVAAQALKKQAGSPFSMTGWKPILPLQKQAGSPFSIAGWKPAFQHSRDGVSVFWCFGFSA
jgi:hypothetical protein